MDVDVLGRIVRVGDGSQQKLAEPALPQGAPMHQLVADDEDRLGDKRQDGGRDTDFPDGEAADDQHLPEREHERHRPERRPQPEREFVQEQLALAGRRRIHVPLLEAEEVVEPVREHEEGERTREPPSAVHGGGDDERENEKRNEVRERVRDGGLDDPPARCYRGAGTMCFHPGYPLPR